MRVAPTGLASESEPPWPGVVVLHGAGSRKENHSEFARAANGYGWGALTFDQRGHGSSEDEMSPAAMGDVARMARLLAECDGADPDRICVRGSSMGGSWRSTPQRSRTRSRE